MRNTKKDFKAWIVKELGYSVESEEFNITAETFGYDDEYSTDYQEFLKSINKVK
jgi:hypothetical protein